jgi:hypothetical protein
VTGALEKVEAIMFVSRPVWEAFEKWKSKDITEDEFKKALADWRDDDEE